MDPNGSKKIEEGKAMMERADGEFIVRIDLTNQILLLDIEEEKEYGGPEKRLSKTLSPSVKREATLYPTLKDAMAFNDFLSASMVSAKAKAFDDGLLAAVEMAAQNGEGDFRGKKSLLSNIRKALRKREGGKELEYITAFIRTALELGGEKSEEEKSPLKEEMKRKFREDLIRSEPIGFYTWNDSLKQIFRQDRFLQTELDDPALLAETLARTGDKESYIRYLNFLEKLNNPLVREIKDLRPILDKISRGEYPSSATGDRSAFLPPSRAYETELIKKLYRTRPIPENFNLVEQFIEEIKTGRLDLTPKENSGWYDYQTYSLEPLILPEKTPEATKLEFSKNYRKELVELFKSILSLTRETHIKQLEIPLVGAAPPEPKPIIHIYPHLSLEPLATYYLRRARAYHFIHKVLLEFFGKEGLKRMRRLSSEGPVKKNLEEELSNMQGLFLGAALLVSSEIGCPLDFKPQDGSGRGEKADREFAKEWIKNISTDPDLSRDSRMMVPVFFDTGRKKIKVWVFLGYEKKNLSVEYRKTPKVTIFNKEGRQLTEKDVDIEFHSSRKDYIYPIFAEIYVDKIFNRDQFRALCDEYKTRSEILEALQR